MLSGTSSRGTPCFHWNYRLLPLQLPLAVCNTVGTAHSCPSGYQASDRPSITPNLGKGTQIGALINLALNPLQLPLRCMQIQLSRCNHMYACTHECTSHTGSSSAFISSTAVKGLKKNWCSLLQKHN